MAAGPATVSATAQALYSDSQHGAGVAQLAEQLLCKHQVVGSIPTAGTIRAAVERPSPLAAISGNRTRGPGRPRRAGIAYRETR